MPDDKLPSTHVSIRAPSELVQAFDRIATILDRDRSWVMLRALRAYLDHEGREILEDAEAISELDRGGGVSFAEAIEEAEKTSKVKARKRGAAAR